MSNLVSRPLLTALLVLVFASIAFSANDRPLIFGQNPVPTSWWGYDANTYDPVEFDRIRDSGGTSCRIGVNWDQIEPTRGTRNWSEIDRWVKYAIDRNITPVLLINSTPTWALPYDINPDIPVPQARYPCREDCLADFNSFIYELVRRYRGRAQYYEYWNEANGYGWHWDQGYNRADEYTPWMIRAYKQLKLADPTAKMSTTGMDDNGGGGDYFLQKLYDHGAQGYFDAVADHPYSPGALEEWKLNDIRALLDSRGDSHVDIWITEMGWPANGRESTVAGWITDFFNKLVNNHPTVKIATYHTAMDFPWEDVGYGLVDRYFNPKPTWNAFRDYPKPSRPVISNVTVTNLSPSSARVNFNTNIPARGLVMYGLTDTYGMITGREATAVTGHAITLIGLNPGTTYHYRILAGAMEYADSYSADYTFTTSSGSVVHITSGPTVSNITSNSATVTWTTDVASAAVVEYGLDFAYGHSVERTSPATTHTLQLTGLQSGTNYQFRVVSTASGYGDAAKEGTPFTTASGAPALVNGGFEDGFTSGVGNGWTKFVISGSPGFYDRTQNVHGGSHAQAWWTSYSTHDAGIYQQVSASSGTQCTFRAWTWRHDAWNNSNANETTWVGIDPYGGTNPLSPNVVWSTGVFSYETWTHQSVSAVAQSPTITVFVRGTAHWAGDSMIAVVDDASLETSGPTTGTISGYVRDMSNAAIGGALVSTNTGGYSTVTGSDGRYVLENVAPATYSVTAAKDGYQPRTVNNVVVTSGQTTSCNFNLSTSVSELVNGGFENGSTGWTFWEVYPWGYDREPDGQVDYPGHVNVHTDNQGVFVPNPLVMEGSKRLTHDAGFISCVGGLYQTINVPNGYYAVSGWVYAGCDGGDELIELRALDGPYTGGIPGGTAVCSLSTLSDQWKYYSKVVQVTTGKLTVATRVSQWLAYQYVAGHFDGISVRPAFQGGISDLKDQASGQTVATDGTRAVTMIVDPNTFYIQEDDRSSGIRVQTLSPHGLSRGQRAAVIGTLAVIDGEAVIADASISETASGSEPKALGMNNASVGGAEHGVQPGITGAHGLNNVGLLIRTWGAYERLDSSHFTVNDGSGTEVLCVVPAGVTLGDNWQYVTVTGISSCYEDGTSTRPLLRVRVQSDISVAQ